MNKRQLDENKLKDSDWKSYNQLTQRERIGYKTKAKFNWRLICIFFFKNDEEGD